MTYQYKLVIIIIFVLSVPYTYAMEKLDSLAEACHRMATETEHHNELLALHEYLIEATRQKDVKHETNARTLRLYAFYNNNLTDSLNIHLNDDLHFMEQHRQWTNYYSCRSLRVERLQYDNKLHSALYEAEAMYAKAADGQSDYGKGISAYLIASCYQSMGRDEEALCFFDEAENLMWKDFNVGQLHNLYGMMWQSLAATGNNDKLLQLTVRWENLWKDYCEKNNLQLTDVAPYYVVCLLARAHANIHKNNLRAAHEDLERSEKLADGQRDIVQLLLLKEQILFEEATGNYHRALELADKRHLIQTKMNNMLGTLETEEMRARLLLRLGQYKSSAKAYEALLPQKDSLTRRDLTIQLDDLATLYQLDALKHEKEQYLLLTKIAFTGLGILILFLLSYLYYRYRMGMKNKAIYLQYEKQQQAEKVIDRMLVQNSVEEFTTPDMLLFMEIRKYLQNPEIIADTSLERNGLAEHFNTNYDSIAKAIRAGADTTVKRYINRMRVDYACILLKDPKLAMYLIQEKCGFNSSSTFNRVFKEFTGMSPRDFRKEAIK